VADFPAPVATQIKPPDPMQGINTMSGILGLQQQRQALQTGQYTQDTAQANAQMTQQDAANRQAAGSFFKNFDIAKHHGDDGTLDLDSALTSPEFKATGDASPEIAKSLLAIKNSQLQAKTGLAALNGTLRGQFSSQVAGLAQDPDVKAGNQTGSGKVLDALDQFGKVGGPDAQRVAGIYGQVLRNTPPAKMAQALQNLQLQAKSAGEQLPTTTAIDTGPTIQGGSVAPGTGAITPAGPPVRKDLAPTEQIPYKAAATSATASAASRATGVAGSDIDRANQISANIKAAPAGIQTTQQIDDLADQIHSGKFAAWVSKGAASVGLSEATYARQLLEKDLGIVKTQLTSAAPSDSRAATILSGTPEATSDPQTIHGAMDYVRGSFRQNQAQGKNLSAYKAKHPDLGGFQSADDALTGGAGPLVHEFISLKGKDQQAAFYRRNFSNAQQAKEFRDKARASAHTLGLDNADDR
jgi:hypothetical protein